MRRALSVLALAVLVLIAAAPPPSARACAGVGRSGPVFVRGEEALIVWDDAHHIEHFIRRALFQGETDDFGFLVPTPSRPELTEVSSTVFDDLFRLYGAPRPRARARGRRSTGGGGHASDAVIVLEEREVAGMDAAVLAAADPQALEAWLRSHEYVSSPGLTAYLAPYVSAGWIVTAFRFPPGSFTLPRFAASVRMSFATERPVFPYSEPRTGAPPRRFRVSVASRERMRGYLDAPSAGARAPWVAAAFAGRPILLPSMLASALPSGVVAGPWLTTFDERASRRGTRDLFFERDPDQRERASRITTAITPE